jgi:hypothetical protein
MEVNGHVHTPATLLPGRLGGSQNRGTYPFYSEDFRIIVHLMKYIKIIAFTVLRTVIETVETVIEINSF